jgi:hypothetical protein
MAISTMELALENAEFLPDREVMTGGGRCGCRPSYFHYVGDDQNSNWQFGLVNVNVQDVNILAID